MNMTSLKWADLVEAMGRMHRHRCHILDLVSPTPGRTLFGQAGTISYFPSCSADLDPRRYTLANLFYEAVGDEPVVGCRLRAHTLMQLGPRLKIVVSPVRVRVSPSDKGPRLFFFVAPLFGHVLEGLLSLSCPSACPNGPLLRGLSSSGSVP